MVNTEAIYKAGGKKILQECQHLRKTKYPDELSVGQSVIMTAGNLKVKYIIHTVGPQYRFDSNPEQSLLACLTRVSQLNNYFWKIYK